MNTLGTPLTILALFTELFSQTVDTPYTVATWRGFRSAAVSYTFDDGCSNQFAVAIPMFNTKGYKLTLFTVVTGGMFPGWQKLQSAASQGHEIASHTMDHSDMSGMTAANQVFQLQNSRDSINAHIPGRQCITMAYPYCSRGIDSLAAKYYIACRTCSGQIIAKNPTNFADISSFGCGDQSSNNSTAALNTLANNAVSSGGWCVYLFHGIDNDGGYSPVTTATLQGGVDYMSANPLKFWVESFGNVARYIRERNATSVRTLLRTTDSIVVRLTDGLNDTIFNYPLTIRRPLPSEWQTFKVTQGANTISAQAKDSNNVRYLYFDAVPDSGDVIISRNMTAARYNSARGCDPDVIRVGWCRNSLVLSGLPTDGRTISITLFDLKGALLDRISGLTPQSETSILPPRFVAQNTTIIVIADPHADYIKRYLLQPQVMQ
jgi:hypothetical protein